MYEARLAKRTNNYDNVHDSTMDEAKEACQGGGVWKCVVSAYPNGKSVILIGT